LRPIVVRPDRRPPAHTHTCQSRPTGTSCTQCFLREISALRPRKKPVARIYSVTPWGILYRQLKDQWEAPVQVLVQSDTSRQNVHRLPSDYPIVGSAGPDTRYVRCVMTLLLSLSSEKGRLAMFTSTRTPSPESKGWEQHGRTEQPRRGHHSQLGRAGESIATKFGI
jgi:hypothetical protein